jgi:hypothetical protein
MTKRVVFAVFFVAVFCGMAYSQAAGGRVDAYKVTRYAKFGEDFTNQVEVCYLLKFPSGTDTALMLTKKGRVDFTDSESILDIIELKDYNSGDKQYKKVVFTGNELKEGDYSVAAVVTISNGKLHMQLVLAEVPDLILVELEATFVVSTDSLN